jgi:hypothetical protein
MPVPYNNTMCITVDEWQQAGLSYWEYKHDQRRGDLELAQGGGNGRKVYIKVDSIKRPERKDAVMATYPSLHIDSVKKFVMSIEPDYKAREFYASFKLEDGRYLPAEKQKEYVANAEVLNAIVRQVNDRTAYRKSRGGSIRGIWPDMAKVVEEAKPELGHSLPANHRRLQAKAEQHKKESYMSLISGKWMNSNSSKVKEMEQESSLRQLMRKHQNLDNEQIRTVYNVIAQELGWDELTAQTVANYKAKWELETYSGRKGVTNFDNNKAMMVKRKAPSYPLYYWTMDGWDVELLYQKTELDKNGHSRTTYHNRLTVVAVLDPVNKYPIGYAVGTHETPALIRQALRNAVKHTEDLFGRKHKVLQLQTDNYGKGTLKPFYEAISEIYTPARVKNSKSKVVERYFLTLNKKYCQLMNNWSGFGVTANKDSQPNDDYLNAIRHSFPDEAGLRAQIYNIFRIERATKVEQYKALYAEMPEEDKIELSEMDYLLKLGEDNGETNRLTGIGIVKKIGGVTYEFDSMDVRLRQNSHIDWTVKYDPEDMSRAIAVNADQTIRIELAERYTQPMALREQGEEDRAELKEIKGYNKKLKSDIMTAANDDYRMVNDLFERNPQLNGTLAKLMLTDSRGQHKDQKSKSRLAEAGHKILQIEAKKAPEPSKRSDEEAYLLSKINVAEYFD